MVDEESSKARLEIYCRIMDNILVGAWKDLFRGMSCGESVLVLS